MAVTDTDYSLIMLRLAQFEDKLKKLEQEITVLNAYVDTQLENKYYPKSAPDGYTFLDATGGIGCKTSAPYVLSSGSLMDSGSVQKWSKPTDINIYAEFQVAREGQDIEE